ncbi:MAG: DUF1573 domain-containing protein [Prevotella sp.]|nr:DUF1573 domain-containing protein [Prevotella sp.]
MKRTLYLILIALLSLPAAAQQIAAENDTIYCGKTGFKQPVKAVFHLRNTSRSAVTISGVETDCGCTTAQAPRRVAPGASFDVTLTYDARQLGHYQKQALVRTKGGSGPLQLVMRGQVCADVYDYSQTFPYDMRSLRCDREELLFDDVQRGETPTVVLHVVNDGDKTMTPNLMHLPSYLSAVCTPEHIRPNQQADISVTLNSERLHDYGLTQTSIHLAQQLGDKVSPDNELTVSVVLLPAPQATADGAAAPAMHLSATRLDMGSFGKKKQLKGYVDISNRGQAPLDISSLQMFSRGLRVTLPRQTIAAGQTVRMKITAIADELRGAHTAPRILMITNDPRQPKAIIEIRTSD